MRERREGISNSDTELAVARIVQGLVIVLIVLVLVNIGAGVIFMAGAFR